MLMLRLLLMVCWKKSVTHSHSKYAEKHNTTHSTAHNVISWIDKNLVFAERVSVYVYATVCVHAASSWNSNKRTKVHFAFLFFSFWSGEKGKVSIIINNTQFAFRAILDVVSRVAICLYVCPSPSHRPVGWVGSLDTYKCKHMDTYMQQKNVRG